MSANLQLTQLSTVKARLRIDDSDVIDDVLLTNFIFWISDRFENDCNRSFSLDTYSDEFQGDETELRLKAIPIVSVTGIAIKSTEAEGYIDQTANVDYIIRGASILSLRGKLGTPEQIIKITYTGGFVLPGATVLAGQTALPDDLEKACVEQVAYLYINRNRPDVVSLSGEGGSISKFSKLDLLPTVQATLGKFERWMP